MGSSIRFVTHNRHGDPSDVIQPGYGKPFTDSLHRRRLTTVSLGVTKNQLYNCSEPHT